MGKRILVVTSCTGDKLHNPSNKLNINDFKDIKELKRRESELEEYSEEAVGMYTGAQHLALMDGIKEYRFQGGNIDVDILSAGYGMLRENVCIVPYEVTFSTMSSDELKTWSEHLNITSKLQDRIIGYDLVFFLLGKKYLDAIKWPLVIRQDQKLIFFASEGGKYELLFEPNHYLFAVRTQEAKAFRSGLIELKGRLFSSLLKYINVNSGHNLWNDIYNKPQLIRQFIINFYNNDRLLPINQYSDEYEELLPVYTIDAPEVALNYGHNFNYYMPENDDRVDPDYKFIEDMENRLGQEPLEHDVYAHELYGMSQYDGILISISNIQKPKATQQKINKINEIGIREFLRLPGDYKIMGDCGAFSYVDKEPPYTTDQVLEYYHSMGFDYGVSVDHLIFGRYKEDKKKRVCRYNLTLDNAFEFIEKYKQNQRRFGYTFTPIGVAQGWDPVSFHDAVKELIDMGYNYVALGGLAREKSFIIYEILKKIATIIPDENFRMHLFGVVRDNMEYMKVFHKLGVTSFDSASPLRRAWLGPEHNYYSVKKHYAAVRISDPSSSPRVKQQIKEYLGEEYFSSKQNYNIINTFFKSFKDYIKKSSFKNFISISKDDINCYIEEFNKEYGTDIVLVIRNADIFNLSENNLDSYGMVEIAYNIYNKYSKLEEYIFSTLNKYDSGELCIDACVAKIKFLVKKVNLKNYIPDVYVHVFSMFNNFKDLEEDALNSIRSYDKGTLDIDSTLNSLLKYDEELGENRESHASYYRDVLMDQPWKECKCNICIESGVEVIIFRGNNRNRRRGFHNTHIFYNDITKLKEMIRLEINEKKNLVYEVP